jgi:hypothetical protein
LEFICLSFEIWNFIAMRLFTYYPSNPKKLDPEMEKRIFFHSLVHSGGVCVCILDGRNY